MNKNKLFSVLDSKINRALKERDAQNVVDLRLYIEDDICTGIFSIKDKEEIYNSVKDVKKVRRKGSSFNAVEVLN